MDGRTHGRTDRQSDGWMDGWKDGWTDGYTGRQIDCQAKSSDCRFSGFRAEQLLREYIKSLEDSGCGCMDERVQISQLEGENMVEIMWISRADLGYWVEILDNADLGAPGLRRL